jgi:hypothetical protein
VGDLDKRIRELSENLIKIDNFTTNDIETFDAKVKRLNEEQENLYGILLGLEGELKHQKRVTDEDSIKLERAASYSDLTIQNVENTAIITHLAHALQTVSVTTVVNYLRYYFSYHATLLTKGILKVEPSVDIYVAQAVAVKMTLIKHFGVYFNEMFSAVNFADSRVGKVISIYKEQS